MTFPELPPLNLSRTAASVRQFWQQHSIFCKTLQERASGPTFTFYEGPPSANGAPGIHHVLPRTLKDLFCRYKTQQGFSVQRKAGWDTHGLPVELSVEKALGITKEDIGTKISVEDYNAQCRKTVLQYKDQWDALTNEMGYWLDMEHPYVTFETDYMESLWQLLKQLYDKGLLYKGYAIQPYSPAAGTGLSAHELNQPGCYKTVKDTSLVAQFQAQEAPGEYFLAWTTTPWTLPANSALAVGVTIDYVKVRTFNPYTHQPVCVILAENALSRYFSTPQTDEEAAFEAYQPGQATIPWQVVSRCKGQSLVGQTYHQLMPYVTPATPAFRIIAGDFVNTEEGTGIVHIAPTFGADDMRVAQQAGIPPITVQRGTDTQVPIVDRQGRFVEEIVDFAGQHVKEAYAPEAVREQPDYKSVDVQIAIRLKQDNKAFQVAKYAHSYPHCWRTDKPVLYYPMDAWFIRTTACKERLIALNKTIRWQPDATGTGRFGNWLENLVDWNLSRDRYWGTPLPIWRTEDQTEERCIGSIADLRQEVDKAVAAGFMEAPLPAEIDLHRPHVDRIVLVSATGKPMYRETDLIDVWFDSGAMPYAQWHYPFENKAQFEQSFPADFIAEGVDQTRGWFFTLHVLAVLLHDTVAFKQVIANGLVLDAQGNKMSKRLGNTIDPFAIMDQYGPDALRWYIISNANPWDNLKFSEQGLTEVTRRFFATLNNTYGFFALYANIDQLDLAAPQVPLAQRPEIDRWILSRLESLVKKVTAAYEAYTPTPVARAIQDFVVDELSNWYVRLNRKRFWQSEAGPDKLAAYQTLYTCLVTITKLSAPIAPFYMDALYRALQHPVQAAHPESVHLTDFPAAAEASIDVALEKKMGQAQQVVSLVHSLRKQHQLKVRQPLAKLLVPLADAASQAELATLFPLIQAEVNVKQVACTVDATAVITKKIKPNFRSLGKHHGQHMKAITEAIAQLDQAAIAALEQGDAIALSVGQETEIAITLADVIITSEDIPGWAVASDGEITVALDITLNDALRQEGIARDVVNRLQNLRKERDLAVQDKIMLAFAVQDAFVREAIAQHQEYISRETQALQMTFSDQLAGATLLELDGYTLDVVMDVAATP